MHLCTVQEKKWLSRTSKVPGFVLDAGDPKIQGAITTDGWGRAVWKQCPQDFDRGVV